MRDKLIELLEDTAHEKGGNPSFSEIADYLLANGVIVPPCKVGDTVYQTDGVKIYDSTIIEITFSTHKIICVTENIAFDETAIGKTVFLTKEEAENVLRKEDEGK